MGNGFLTPPLKAQSSSLLRIHKAARGHPPIRARETELRPFASNKGGAIRTESGYESPRVEAAYLTLVASGELTWRAEAAQAHLDNCDLCARYCHVNRHQTINGAVCRTVDEPS